MKVLQQLLFKICCNSKVTVNLLVNCLWLTLSSLHVPHWCRGKDRLINLCYSIIILLWNFGKELICQFDIAFNQIKISSQCIIILSWQYHIAKKKKKKPVADVHLGLNDSKHMVMYMGLPLVVHSLRLHAFSNLLTTVSFPNSSMMPLSPGLACEGLKGKKKWTWFSELFLTKIIITKDMERYICRAGLNCSTFCMVPNSQLYCWKYIASMCIPDLENSTSITRPRKIPPSACSGKNKCAEGWVIDSEVPI